MGTSIAEQIVNYWTQMPDLSLRPGCSTYALDHFERKHNVVVPPTMRELYLLADGFEQTARYQDDKGFNFWPLEKITSVSQYDDGAFAFEQSDRHFLFADYLDFSWGYSILLGPVTTIAGVYLIGASDRRPHLVGESLETFLTLYGEDDASIYAG